MHATWIREPKSAHVYVRVLPMQRAFELVRTAHVPVSMFARRGDDRISSGQSLQVTAERRQWPKFGNAAKSNEGVTVQSVDEIMFERNNIAKKDEKSNMKPENALVRLRPQLARCRSCCALRS